jgi:hypothetical protein
MDADGHPFSQKALVEDIGDEGARLSGLERPLKPRDIVGVSLGSIKARCQVVWAADAGPLRKLEVGVKILEGQLCPWQKEMRLWRAAGTAPISRAAPVPKDKRKYPRRRISFPIEIRDGQSVGTHMNTVTADMAGGGCYIETLRPLPVKKLLNVTLWLNSERVQTSAIVRTSDGGVGMGIEFTGLDEATKKQLQDLIEILAAGHSLLKKARGAV